MPRIPTISTPHFKTGHPADELIVERYKYIVNEMHHLNDNIHKYITLFQTLATAIIGLGIAYLASWEKLSLTPETSILVIRSLEVFLALVAMFIALSVFANVRSWFDYRKEETLLLDRYVGKGFRKPPSLRNLLRWSETYFVLFIIVFAVAVIVTVETQLLPRF